MCTEEWRAVVGYEGFYEVSNFGNMRTNTRTFLRPHNKTSSLVEYTYKGAPIKPWINATTGYPMVVLNRRGEKKKKESVHRMVLFAFVGAPSDGMICCHADGNPKNNRLENLRWDTYSSNVADARRHGRAALGEKNKSAKLTATKVQRIRKRLKDGDSCAEISRTYDVTPEAIGAIKLGKNWAWLPHEGEFA